QRSPRPRLLGTGETRHLMTVHHSGSVALSKPSTRCASVATGAGLARRTVRRMTGLLFRQLVRKDLELEDLRRSREEIARLGLFHQGSGHLAVEMRVAAGLVVEAVENGEGRRTLLDGMPGDRARLVIDERDGRSQEIGDFLLLAGLRLQWNVESKLRHRRLLR